MSSTQPRRAALSVLHTLRSSRSARILRIRSALVTAGIATAPSSSAWRATSSAVGVSTQAIIRAAGGATGIDLWGVVEQAPKNIDRDKLASPIRVFGQGDFGCSTVLRFFGLEDALGIL